MRKKTDKAAALSFLDLFYPTHYLVGIQIEDAMRSGVLTRQQACILWLIRTEGDDGMRMRRKDVERALTAWYEVTSSAVSKSIRALTKPPLDLVVMKEDPENGREKLVSLTPRGQTFVENMIRNGAAYIDMLVERLTEDEIKQGIHFLSRVAEVHHELRAQTGRNSSKTELA